MGQQNCETSAVIVFAYRLDYKGLRWSYVTELLDTLWVLSFLREILPFHMRFSVMPFHCVHIISIWSFTINRYLPDDKCVPRCISALLISKNCMTQFLWLNGRFFFPACERSIRASEVPHRDDQNHAGTTGNRGPPPEWSTFDREGLARILAREGGWRWTPNIAVYIGEVEHVRGNEH